MIKSKRKPLNPDTEAPGPGRYKDRPLTGTGKKYIMNPKRKNFDPSTTDYTKAPGPKYSPNFEANKKRVP